MCKADEHYGEEVDAFRDGGGVVAESSLRKADVLFGDLLDLDESVFIKAIFYSICFQLNLRIIRWFPI